MQMNFSKLLKFRCTLQVNPGKVKEFHGEKGNTPTRIKRKITSPETKNQT